MQSQNENWIDKCNSFHLNGVYFKKNISFSCRQENVSLHHSGIRNQDMKMNFIQPNTEIRKSIRVMIMNPSSNGEEKDSQKSESEGSVQGRPSEEQLENVFKSLNDHVS